MTFMGMYILVFYINLDTKISNLCINLTRTNLVTKLILKSDIDFIQLLKVEDIPFLSRVIALISGITTLHIMEPISSL